MIQDIFSFLAEVMISVISYTGYFGIGILMAIDSCNIPVPSEITMLFSGFLAHQGTFALWWVIVAGTVGSVVGSFVSYELAGWIMKQRTRVAWLRVLLSDHAIAVAEKWFLKYGAAAVCIGRIVPVVRTFISLPAGVARMNRTIFLWYTTLGSFVWCTFLAYGGYMLGEQWRIVEIYMRDSEYVILGIGVVLIIWYAIRRARSLK